ncbi:hypothetical protein OH460_08945 [Vibrio sp. Makdt]|uniref:hypothetical protein n=1 Tax=Vibrio sp. Makdt TaxID=2998828 RepID=UPI0022CD33DA|nr:hypothetical protein [Vibrio sp. Makdt]MDA0152428.1 hypothetical protein [Vibrio sp. Makdt]
MTKPSKTILWAGVGSQEHCLVYSQQISSDFEHIVQSNFELDNFSPEDHHCCFVFSGVTDQKLFSDISKLSEPNVFTFVDGQSVVNHRRSSPTEIMLLHKDGFTFFTNDKFVNICLEFDLIAYQVSSSHNPLLKSEPSSFGLINSSIDEINVWTKDADFSCEIRDYKSVNLGQSISQHIDPNNLMEEYIYIGAITPYHLVQIFYPFSDDEAIFRQYLTAMARRLGSAKTISVNNTHKPLHSLIKRTEKKIEMFHLNAVTNDKNCSIYIMLKERDL